MKKEDFCEQGGVTFYFALHFFFNMVTFDIDKDC